MSEPSSKDGNLVTQQEWLRYLLPHVYTSLKIISYEDAAIYDDKHFVAPVYDVDVDVPAPKYVSVVAPDTSVRIALRAEIAGSAAFFWEFYEAPPINAAGALVTIHNSDRNSLTASTVVVRQDCTTQAPNNDGTLLISGYSGGDKQGGTSGISEEWILKQGETYIFKITAIANDLLVAINPMWIEET